MIRGSRIENPWTKRRGMCKTSKGITGVGNIRNGCRFGYLRVVEVHSMLVGCIRITLDGVDKLPLTTIEVKNQQNQLN